MKIQASLSRILGIFIDFIALRNLFQRRRKINLSARHAAAPFKALCLVLSGLLLLGCISGDPILGLTALYLSPQSAFVTIQDSITFTAYGILNNDTSNPQNESLNVVWQNPANGIVSTVTDGIYTGLSPGGPVSVSATGNIGLLENGVIDKSGTSITAFGLLTVSNSPLVSIAINPINPAIPLGGSVQLTAIGTFADGTTADITNSVVWSSSLTTAFTISNAATPSGSNTGLAVGGGLAITAPGANVGQSTSIQALTSVDGVDVYASIALNISGSVLTSISVTPATSTLTAGSTQQYAALGTFTSASGATTVMLAASELTWSSSDTQVASIISGGGCIAAQNTGDSCGLANAVGIGGPINITASVTVSGQIISGNAQLSSATGATLLSIDVEPIAQSVAPGTTQQYTAQGIFSDGSTLDVTDAVNWTSSNTAAASINAQGLAAVPTGATAGSDTIIGASTQVSGQTVSAIAILTVASKTLTSISVTPAIASVAVNGTQQFTATGTYSDNSTQNLTSSAVWASSSLSATIVSGNSCTATPNTSNSCGFATGVAAGSPVTITASVTATGQTINGTAQLTVTSSSPTLTSISVTPVSASVAVNGTQQFTATGTYSDNSTQDLTGSVAWSSSDPSVATIVSGNGCSATPNTSNSCGFATGVAVGSPVTITASVTASGQTFTSTASFAVSVLACNPPPNPPGGGSLPYENESYCASFSGLTDQGYTFTGTLTFTTPITPGAIINCEYATSGTWNSLPASTGPTPCTGGIDPYGNLNVTDALGNTFTGTFSSDGTSVSGTYSFTDFGPGGGVAAGSFSGTEQ